MLEDQKVREELVGRVVARLNAEPAPWRGGVSTSRTGCENKGFIGGMVRAIEIIREECENTPSDKYSQAFVDDGG